MRFSEKISLFLLVIIFTSMGFADELKDVMIDAEVKAYDWFGCSVDIDGPWAVVGARYDDEGAGNSGAAYIYKKEGPHWRFVQKLKTNKPKPGANFGFSVSIKGDYIIVGAQLQHARDRDSGAAYIFKRQPAAPTHSVENEISQRPWKMIKKLVPANGQQYDQFGFSVDIQKDYAVVGAIVRCDTDREANVLNGAAYVFKNDNDKWIEMAYIKKPDPQHGDQLGQSIAIEGDCLYIGSADKGKGAVHVFKLVNSTWRHADVIEVEQGTKLSRFATSLDVDNGNLIVGSKFEDDKGRNAGCAYIYRKTERTEWNTMGLSKRPVARQFLLAEDGKTAGLTMEYFGKPDFTKPIKKLTHTADILKYSHEGNEKFPMLDKMENFAVRFTGFLTPGFSGEYVISTPSDDASSLYLDGERVNDRKITLLAGKKYNLKLDYSQNQGGYVINLLWQTPIDVKVLSDDEKQALNHTWKLVQKIYADDAAQGDAFGTDVSINGNHAVVSAPYAKFAGVEKAGVAYLFKNNDGKWKQVRKYQSSSPKFRDRFGSAVAINSDDIFVGAMNADQKGNESGAVYPFSVR